MTSYEEQKDPLDILRDLNRSEGEVRLIGANTGSVIEKLVAEFNKISADGSILLSVALALHIAEMRDTFNEFDVDLDRLMGESEALIDSEVGKTPEGLAKRRQLKEEINKLLDHKALYSRLIPNAEEAEETLRKATPAQVEEAKTVYDRVKRAVRSTHMPKTDTN